MAVRTTSMLPGLPAWLGTETLTHLVKLRKSLSENSKQKEDPSILQDFSTLYVRAKGPRLNIMHLNWVAG